MGALTLTQQHESGNSDNNGIANCIAPLNFKNYQVYFESLTPYLNRTFKKILTDRRPPLFLLLLAFDHSCIFFNEKLVRLSFGVYLGEIVS